jgi:hypothetical protein
MGGMRLRGRTKHRAPRALPGACRIPRNVSITALIPGPWRLGFAAELIIQPEGTGQRPHTYPGRESTPGESTRRVTAHDT